MVNQDFISEVSVSDSATLLKITLMVVPTTFGGFGAAAAIQTFVLHERAFPFDVLLFWLGIFCVSAGFSFFVLSRLMDAAYAKVGILSLRKGKSVIHVPYADIKKMGVFRGRSGSVAWVRTCNPMSHGRLIFFVASDNYATSWPAHAETTFLWKLVNQGRDANA